MAEQRKPHPHEDARYGIAMVAAYGMFDTAGWPAVPLRMEMGKKPKPAGVVGKILRRIVLGPKGGRR